MTGQCNTCRFWRLETKMGTRIADDKPVVWDEANRRYIYPYEPYEYTEPTEHEGWRPCALFNDLGRDDAKLTYGGHDAVTIETAPDFGCVQHTPVGDLSQGEGENAV